MITVVFFNYDNSRLCNTDICGPCTSNSLICINDNGCTCNIDNSWPWKTDKYIYLTWW